jgi:hypothetical protein
MSQDEKSLRKSIDRLEATESVLQQEVGELINTPSRRQREILEDLNRLQNSLRGPEDLLDRSSYSRPIPPKRVSYGRGNSPERGPETPFGRAVSGS